MFGIFFKKCGFLLLILHYLFFYDHFLEVDSKIFLASKYLVKNISAHLRAESLSYFFNFIHFEIIFIYEFLNKKLKFEKCSFMGRIKIWKK